ncbi:MAG: hypothetical protein WAW37_14985 [Syntrophobacteraceae bacterium]
MPEIPIRIPVEDGQISLEGLFREGDAGRNAVICHPHPLYGGNMDNNVVEAAQRAFAARGWGTLRYNFRGVGGSAGRAGDGEKEALDLIEVCRHLEGLHPGALDVAGYSYGAWTVLRAVRLGLDAGSFCLFSPPLEFMSFEGLELPDRPILITLGNQDDFCSVESLREWLSIQPHANERVSFDIIPYCDHFYWEHGQNLSAKIEAFLKKTFPGLPG